MEYQLQSRRLSSMPVPPPPPGSSIQYHHTVAAYIAAYSSSIQSQRTGAASSPHTDTVVAFGSNTHTHSSSIQ
eukprot:25269-Rhodomonas_salina.1